MSRLVLDCSIAAAWFFEDEQSDLAEHVLGSLAAQEAVVPGIWPLELANVLVIAERGARVTTAKSERFLAGLADLPIVVDHQGADLVLTSVLALARLYGLTAYDAAYLELALRLGLPLASLDGTLRGAATKAGVALVSAEV
jgi:predicted nucleic acid-binding protein